MPNIGLPEIIIVLVIALVIFGPKRLPDLGKSLGKGMREFKDSVGGLGGGDDEPKLAKAEQTAEPRKAEQTAEPRKAEQTAEPRKAEQTAEPRKAEQTAAESKS